MRGRAGLACAALALAGVLALSVFPAKAWLDQRQNRKALAAQLAVLSAENRTLEDRVAQLRSDEEIERLARQYNLVRPGEEQYFILPRPEAPGPRPAPPAPPAPPEPEPDPEPGGAPSVWERITSVF